MSREDNIKSKLKNLFGIKEKNVSVQFQRPQTKELIFTPEVLREIGPESPANNRIKTIRELCDIVTQKKLEENAIEALWGSIKDLLGDSVPQENRQIALQFLQCLVQGQLQYLGILRAHFFHIIENLHVPSDLPNRLDLFRTLSEDGRNLQEFEESAGPFLLQWMPDVMSADKLKDFLEILVNIIKYNAAYLDEEIVAGLVKNTCMISNRNRTEEDVKLCLDVLDAVLCYSYLPTECLVNFIAALCRMVNIPKYSQASWELMRKLLGTHLGHSSIYTMCCMLQDIRTPVVDQKLLRGAVFFIGMALWGSRKVPTLKHTYSSVLPSFHQVLNTNSYIVAYEIVLSIQRLVKKYGKDLQHVAWSLVLDILESLQRLLETSTQPNQDPRMAAEFHDVLSVIEDLHEHGQFSGCVSRFFKLIETCATKRPEKSVSMLIEYHAQQIHPAKENWITNLFRLLEKYFRNETRTQIRVKALDKLSFVLSINKHLHEDDLINRVVLPHLCHIETDKDPVVRKVAADMLLCLSYSCSPPCFLDIIGLIEKLINKPLIARLVSPFPTVEGSEVIHQLEESHLVDVKTAMIGLVDLFKQKLYMDPPSQCLKIYDLLVSHIKQQYADPKGYTSHTAVQIRKHVVEVLLHLRADNLHRLGFMDKNVDSHLMFSPYLTCKEFQQDIPEKLVESSPAPTETVAFLWSESLYMNYTQSFSIFLSCLENDKDWEVLERVLVNLPLLLQNKTLILSARRDLIDSLCHRLCAMVNDRQLGFPEKLHGTPSGKFNRSDFHAFVFPVLAAMVSYHKYLDRNKAREMIKCLEFGLVSKCAKTCTNSLRICTLEMQDVMMRLLPSVLLQLSKISATVHMAIPVLAFLSSIVRIPRMYANFVEEEYLSVFAIALPYTNPFKFSHYTVSLAHHVIAIWFIRCRLPFRKSFVKFIQKGMKANILQQFEENSTRLLQQNQDSSDRSRANSFNEAALRNRRRMYSGSSISRQNFHPPVDNKLSQFHKELTETCLDVMSRYTYGNYSAIPTRSAVAEFLLNGGQSQTWLLGNKLITITTSGGGGNKSNNLGLCDKCAALYQNTGELQEQKPVAQPSGRRRHKSAVVSRSSCNLETMNRSYADDMEIQARKSLDDMTLSGETSTEKEMGIQTGSSLSDHTPTQLGLETEAMEAYLWGMKKKSDGRLFQNNMCSCWCTGWAEIFIRAPSGNIAWMMRIENETAHTSMQETQMPDITMLFASVQKKEPDLESLHSRIDSGSIGEDEYESLYDQHFPSDHSQDGDVCSSRSVKIYVEEDGYDGFVKQTPARQEEKQSDPEGLEIPKTANSAEQTFSTIKRSNSSPSLLSSSGENLDTRDSQSEIVIVDNPVPFKKEELQHSMDKTDGSMLSTQLQRPEKLPIPAHLNKVESLTHTISPSPEGSESSIHDEVKELPDFRKMRGHTISVVQPAKDDYKSHGTGNKESKSGINPSFVFLQLYYEGVFNAGSAVPLLIPQNETTARAMKMLDHIHPYETHKIGVIYVGPGQTKDEKGILSNEYGSERFASFVQGLGQLLRLSDCNPERVYVGGLDVQGKDGEFAYSWQDESMHVIFHVATLMPNRESDPNCNAKKLHIGNDYVTIVYNDSQEDYRIGIIKGQFNYVNIVIKPLDHESNAVTLQAKEVPFKDSITTDIADILGHKDTKVISDDNLAALVRQIAVNCDLASLVLQRQQSQPQDPFASNWLERLRQIRRLKAKVIDETHSEKSGLNDFTDVVV